MFPFLQTFPIITHCVGSSVSGSFHSSSLFCHLTDRPASGESLVPFSRFNLIRKNKQTVFRWKLIKSHATTAWGWGWRRIWGLPYKVLSSIIERFQEGLNRQCILCLLRLLSSSKTLVSREMPVTEKNFYRILLWELLSLLCSSNLLLQLNPLLKKPQLRSGHTSIPETEGEMMM